MILRVFGYLVYHSENLKSSPGDSSDLLAMGVNGKETLVGRNISLVLSLVSIGALSVCLSRRIGNVRNWRTLPLVCWLTLAIYVDSTIFVSGAALLSFGQGVTSSYSICVKAILLCLSCYMTTKLIYYFLVERVYVIRRPPKPRLRDPLYLFNSFGMLIPYLVVIALNFYFRFAIYENDQCRIGMKRVAMIPLIGFDILVNVYLTSLFLIPLRSLYSYKNIRNSQARAVALRTFIGSCCTLASSVVNLSVVVALNGEPGWICLMCCNVDILFSVLVLHWITSKDTTGAHPSSRDDLPSPNFTPGSATFGDKRKVPRAMIGGVYGDASIMRTYGNRATEPEVMTEITSMGRESCEIRLERLNTLPPNAVTIETHHTREVVAVIPEDADIGAVSMCTILG